MLLPLLLLLLLRPLSKLTVHCVMSPRTMCQITRPFMLALTVINIVLFYKKFNWQGVK